GLNDHRLDLHENLPQKDTLVSLASTFLSLRRHLELLRLGLAGAGGAPHRRASDEGLSTGEGVTCRRWGNIKRPLSRNRKRPPSSFHVASLISQVPLQELAPCRAEPHAAPSGRGHRRSEEHTSALQSRENLVCPLQPDK